MEIMDYASWVCWAQKNAANKQKALRKLLWQVTIVHLFVMWTTIAAIFAEGAFLVKWRRTHWLRDNLHILQMRQTQF